MAADNLSSRRQLEALGGAFVSLQLHLGFSQLYPPEVPEESADLSGAAAAVPPAAAGGAAAFAGTGAAFEGAPARGAGAEPLLPAVFLLGARIAVKFGPSWRGRASTNPTSLTSLISRSIICMPMLR